MSRRARPTQTNQTTPTDDVPAPALGIWLRARARSGIIGNVVVFTVIAATAASRAAHGVLSPGGLVAVVAGAAVAATTTGWVAGFYEGVAAALHAEIEGAVPATEDRLASRRPWRTAVAWAGSAGLWAGAGGVVLAAILRQESAPTPVIVMALLALALPAAVAVDLAARAAGAASGAALRAHRPTVVSLGQRAWRELALPAAGIQAVVNAGVAWMLFHGMAAEGRLTEGRAFEDALLFSALVAGLFGSLGTRWGSIDAAAGRLDLVDADPAARSHPLGPQALVYAAGLTLVATSIVGLAVPAAPSLGQVALARGLLAGGLTLVACALGFVRGALNTAPLDLGPRPTSLPLPAASSVVTGRGRLVGATAAAVVALLALAPVAGTSRASAVPLDEFGLVAELDAVAVRVEYDIPLPAGTGSAPQVVGLIRRTNGGEVANGVAGAPSKLDAVVGGKVANADEDTKGEENNLPQAECAYPGKLTDVSFAFPTDLRGETQGVQPIGHAAATCGTGPTLDLTAVAGSTDDTLALGPAVTVGALAGEGHAAPVDGVLGATSAARASGVSVLDGLVTVAGIEAHGASHTDARPGGAASDAVVDLTGITIAGTTFDLRNGDFVFGDTSVPVTSVVGKAVTEQLSSVLEPQGCKLTVLDHPTTYPQGFLFTRPQPELGVADDGSLAASMAGGLLLVCDIPQDLSAPTGFNPQKVQVLLGFAYTSVAATEDVGGFGLDDIGGGTAAGGAGGGLAPVVTTPPMALPPAVPTTVPAPVAAGDDEPSSGGSAVETVVDRVELLAANFTLDRPWAWVLALGLWVLLAHRGIERVRQEILGASA